VNIQGLGQIDKVSDMTEFTRTCEWCERQFITEWETKAYCSRQHKEQAREHRKRQRKGRVRVTHKRICKGCASEFTTTRKQKLYCHEDCRAWQKAQTKRDRDREWQNQRKGSLRARVYMQSNGKCGICNEQIDSQVAYPEPLSLSIDHIIPRSLGGSHKIDNLQAAHLVCNAKRGARPLA
jgi:CRISPR/Cas system Type II protein with McrA/HNH and RuvC-like nuclease domain